MGEIVRAPRRARQERTEHASDGSPTLATGVVRGYIMEVQEKMAHPRRTPSAHF